MNRRLEIKCDFDNPALIINRNAIKEEKLVYIGVANKKIKYSEFGKKSHIVYIGTTKKGSDRMLGSASHQGKKILCKHGIKELKFFVVTCTKLQKVKTWHKLERALLITFRSMFGTVPQCNNQGNKMRWTDERDYFTEDRLKTVIKQLSE